MIAQRNIGQKAKSQANADPANAVDNQCATEQDNGVRAWIHLSVNRFENWTRSCN